MQKYGLLGKDIGYDLLCSVYEQISDIELEETVVRDDDDLRTLLSDESFGGFNVSGKYKVDVLKYLDEISDAAKKSGAVDVIKRLPDGRLAGYNTDLYGFRYLIEGGVANKKCVILGTGGTATSAARAFKEMGAGQIVLISRDPVIASLRPVPSESGEPLLLGDLYEIAGYSKLYMHYDAEILINCTNVGKTPDFERSPITDHRLSVRMFSSLELAIDMIYEPYRTKFLQDARRLTKCHTKSGLEMLIFRAVVSRNIWLDRIGDANEDRSFYIPVKRNILADQLNVIAIGMPGSGKTTIFRRYAYELGLEFIDTDEETEKLMGRKISEVLAEGPSGEEYFKSVEHRVIKEACSHHRAVIATGGSTVLNPVNRDLLKANGIVVYVKRPIELLDRRGRDISINSRLYDQASAKEGVYRHMADMPLYNTRIFGEKKALTGEGNSYNYELKGFVYYIVRKIDRYINSIADNQWT